MDAFYIMTASLVRTEFAFCVQSEIIFSEICTFWEAYNLSRSNIINYIVRFLNQHSKIFRPWCNRQVGRLTEIWRDTSEVKYGLSLLILKFITFSLSKQVNLLTDYFLHLFDLKNLNFPDLLIKGSVWATYNTSSPGQIVNSSNWLSIWWSNVLLVSRVHTTNKIIRLWFLNISFSVT